jgi:hypothetical protein
VTTANLYANALDLRLSDRAEKGTRS